MTRVAKLRIAIKDLWHSVVKGGVRAHPPHAPVQNLALLHQRHAYAVSRSFMQSFKPPAAHVRAALHELTTSYAKHSRNVAAAQLQARRMANKSTPRHSPTADDALHAYCAPDDPARPIGHLHQHKTVHIPLSDEESFREVLHERLNAASSSPTGAARRRITGIAEEDAFREFCAEKVGGAGIKRTKKGADLYDDEAMRSYCDEKGRRC